MGAEEGTLDGTLDGTLEGTPLGCPVGEGLAATSADPKKRIVISKLITRIFYLSVDRERREKSLMSVLTAATAQSEH